jgi:hypothetical protein
MTENPFEMFRTPEDYVNWDRYDEQINALDLSLSDQARVRSALQYFRAILGETFLKETLTIGHHFVSLFTNAAPRERIYLAELAESMKGLEGSDGFERLKERISSRNPETSAEGVSVLEIARRLHSAGFSISFEPKTYVTQRSGEKRAKFPDLRIDDRDSPQGISVEVSRLLVGESQRKGR